MDTSLRLTSSISPIDQGGPQCHLPQDGPVNSGISCNRVCSGRPKTKMTHESWRYLVSPARLITIEEVPLKYYLGP
jgi:hypothetical protein